MRNKELILHEGRQSELLYGSAVNLKTNKEFSEDISNQAESFKKERGKKDARVLKSEL